MHTAFRDPGIPDGEKSVYTVTVAERPPKLDLISVVGHDGDGYRSIVEVSLGHGNFAMTVEQRFQRAGGLLRAENYRAETRSGTTVVSREEANFLGTAHLQFGGGLAPFPDNVMPLLGGLTLLRGLDFTEGAEELVDLWLAFSVSIPFAVKVEHTAEIDVPAGCRTGWQVRLRPRFTGLNMLMEKVIGGFLPPSVAHFEADPPHRLVRLSFPTGPMPWDPRGLLELVA
ncbi:hypothetical protein ACWDSJ_11240 [Nocardia sp. NPDC003482]|uniref:hypothetical protein n=1 Tax=Nocardia sp. NPDC004068 TaxID=3364303 RepID=UPI0036C238FB